MTTSNEPGYYEEGKFGIRIENVCITEKANTESNFGGKVFCRFQTVTMVPIATNLIDLEILDEAEFNWINEYNMTVRNTLMPLMQELFPDAVEYLIKQTEPIEVDDE